MTPTPTPDVSAEQRESDAAFVEHMAQVQSGSSSVMWREQADRLIALARRATTPAPQREDGYQAGLMRAAEIAEALPEHTKFGQGCYANTNHHHAARAIRAEAAAPNLWNAERTERLGVRWRTAPRVVGQGEPVAWQVKDYADGWITHTDYVGAPPCAEREARRMAKSMGSAFRPLYAAPPAPVPAGEVTEAVLEAFNQAWWELPSLNPKESTRRALRAVVAQLLGPRS